MQCLAICYNSAISASFQSRACKFVYQLNEDDGQGEQEVEGDAGEDSKD